MLSGDVPIELERQFLARHNHADLQVGSDWRGSALKVSALCTRWLSVTHVLMQLAGTLVSPPPAGDTHPPSLSLLPLFSSSFPSPTNNSQILKNIRASVEPRNSVCHSATVFANSLMHCGTTVDAFLRENLDWLKKATNWAKFSATAGAQARERALPLSTSVWTAARVLPADAAADACCCLQRALRGASSPAHNPHLHCPCTAPPVPQAWASSTGAT